MPISVQCDQCGKTLKVPDTAAGKRGKCPCGAILVIPAAGGIQTAPAAPARAPAAAPRRSAAQPSISRGDGGSVSAPATFKKLFNGYLACLLLSFLIGVVVAIVATTLLGSAAAASSKAHEEEYDYLRAKGLYDQNLFLWESGGRIGPKPQEPTPPASMTAPKGLGAGLVILVLGYGVLLLLGLAGAIFLFLFIYKAWALIQDGHPSTSPLMAVLLLFVPLFNIYWMFVAYWGLAKDLNTYAREQGIDARPASEGMVLWGIILALLGCTAPIGYILMLLGFNSIKNTCMDIATAKAAA